ncbi:MAG: peptidylprolyl isomerase [Saprospiraceae bacterium]|nr:peptidylprolyl isomerase [Candidatus Brachybacter algidus]
MFKNCLFFAFCLFVSSSLFSQKDEVLFTVNKAPVTVSEFKYIYEKSNNKNADYSEKSLKESLDLYTRFKLKVAKARDLRLDTLTSLKTELNSYKKQLAESYLTDKEITEKLAAQLYDRSKTDIRIAHIFIAAGPDKLPEDTLKAYAKVMEIAAKLKAGGKFEDLVKQYSEDESSKVNNGDVGFLAPMYPNGFFSLENLVYSLKKGEVGGPARTAAGWHFVKVLDSRPARGEMEIAQILVRINKEVDEGFAKNRIDSIYTALQKGADFNETAKNFSDDKATSGKGGFLGFITIGQYDPTFEDAVFTLKNDGDYTTPFKTALGFHIVKRISKKSDVNFETSKKAYMTKVAQNERFALAKDKLVEKIKKEYKYTLDQKVYKQYVDSINTDKFYTSTWTEPKIKSSPMFTMGGKEYTTDEVSEFLKANSRRRVRMNKGMIPNIAFEELYNEFVATKAMEYEQSQLEFKYPDYKSLTREYEEGFLFFEVTNNEVWNKASQDTIGIDKFFAENSKKYMWEERARVLHYTLKASTPEELNKIYESIRKSTPEELQKKFGTDKVSYTSELIEKSNSGDVAGLDWRIGNMSGLQRNPDGKTGTADKIESITPPSQKELKDARGFVIADYQDYLDKLWVEKLKNEYNVSVNQNVFNSLVKR